MHCSRNLRLMRTLVGLGLTRVSRVNPLGRPTSLSPDRRPLLFQLSLERRRREPQQQGHS
ncbi:MAG: hypothetical protein ACK46L_04895 [Synechococcaceae cyanobacterium]|jgi:hypothetical protein